MRYKRLSSCIQTAFMNIKPFGEEVGCSRELTIPMTLNAVSVMKGMEVVGYAPCKIPECVRF